MDALGRRLHNRPTRKLGYVVHYCVQLAAGIQSAVLIANIQIQIVYTYASLAADARVEDSNLDIHLRNKGKIIFQ